MDRRAFLGALASGLLAAPLTAEGRQRFAPSALALERVKLREAVDDAMRELTPIFRRNPAEPVKADGFNMLLARARQLFPESNLIVKCLKPLPYDFSAVDMTNMFPALSGGIALGMQDNLPRRPGRHGFAWPEVENRG